MKEDTLLFDLLHSLYKERALFFQVWGHINTSYYSSVESLLRKIGSNR